MQLSQSEEQSPASPAKQLGHPGSRSATRNCLTPSNNVQTPGSLSAASSELDFNCHALEYDSDESEFKASSAKTFSSPARKSAYNLSSSHKTSSSSRVQSTKGLTEQNIKLEELRNEIKDLERKLKVSEHENKALKRIQARHEKELLKVESARGDIPDLVKSHNEELRALKNLLRKNKEKQREYEQRLKYRDSELQKLKQELVHLQQLVQEKDLLNRDELAKKLENLELEVNFKNTEIQELKRKLEGLIKNHKQELASERNNHKETQRQLAQLQADYDQLLWYTKQNPIHQNGNLRRGGTQQKSPQTKMGVSTLDKQPKDALNSFIKGDAGSETAHKQFGLKLSTSSSKDIFSMAPNDMIQEKKPGKTLSSSLTKLNLSMSSPSKQVTEKYTSPEYQSKEAATKTLSKRNIISEEEASTSQDQHVVKSIPWTQQNRPTTLNLNVAYEDTKRDLVHPIDYDRKEKLLAKLKEIDQNDGESNPRHNTRRRTSSDVIYSVGPTTRSPVRRANHAKTPHKEHHLLQSTYSPSFVMDTGVSRKKTTDTMTRSMGHSNLLGDLFPRESNYSFSNKLSKSDLDIFGSNNLRPERTASRPVQAETLIFPETKTTSTRVFPWEQRAEY